MIRKSTNDISIKPKLSNNLRLFFIGIGVVLLALLLYLTYNAGISSGNSHFAADKSNIEQLKVKVADLQEKLDDAEEGLVNADLQKKIQEEAYKQMSNAYASSENKNQYLDSRLDFYRSIISPESGEKGPAIQSLDHSVVGDAFKFTLTLVQSINHKSQVQGKVQLFVYSQASETDILLQWPESNQRSVNFQYFQQFSGEFSVADLPENARIRVLFTLQDGTLLERWFDVGAV